jgi:hypothetical protein
MSEENKKQEDKKPSDGLMKELEGEKIDAKAKKSLEQDIIIHHMPSESSLSGVTYESIDPTTEIKEEKSFKKVGLAIIISGLIIVLALVYLGYRYIIEPAMQDNEPSAVVSPPPASQPVAEEPIEEEPVEIIEEEEEEEILPEEEEEEEEEEDLLPEEEEATSSLLNVSLVDSDNDGLSDLAEEYIGTDPLNSDTDSDTYSDLEEIINGYNPLGEGVLSENFSIEKYQADNFSFFYPNIFEVEKIDDDAWLISSVDGSMIQISKRNNELQENIFSWYSREFEFFSPIPNERLIKTGMGQGILNENATMLYFASPDTDYIFVISYFSVEEEFNYFSELAVIIDTILYQ